MLFFTNNGALIVDNESHFGDDRPPYADFINAGTLSASGISFNSFYFENSGTLSAINDLFISGDTGKFNGGSSTSGGASQFVGNNLKFNAYQLAAGGALTFYVTNSLSDGGPGSGNVFTVSDGFNLWVKPQLGDLLGTTFQDVTPATPASRITHLWAGEDRGATPAGYQNNAAIGVLTLQPQNVNSLYTFSGTAGPNGTNAM